MEALHAVKEGWEESLGSSGTNICSHGCVAVAKGFAVKRATGGINCYCLRRKYSTSTPIIVSGDAL